MATDPDSDVVTYTLEGTDADSFAIGAASGVLTTSAALDYETKRSYEVVVRAADEHGNAATLAVTIMVTDVDDASPVFADGTATSREVAENTAPGTAIGAAFVATDPDSDVVTYTLEGTDADSFAIGAASGVLTTSAALDYETKSSYAGGGAGSRRARQRRDPRGDHHGDRTWTRRGRCRSNSTVPVVGSTLTASVEGPGRQRGLGDLAVGEGVDAARALHRHPGGDLGGVYAGVGRRGRVAAGDGELHQRHGRGHERRRRGGGAGGTHRNQTPDTPAGRRAADGRADDHPERPLHRRDDDPREARIKPHGTEYIGRTWASP